MRRYWIAVPLLAALAAGVIIVGQRSQSAPSSPNLDKEKVAQLKPAVSLPISQVIMFNSGVGHFTRSGEIEGDARVDLTFPEKDINDLIKSMTLRDLSPNGKVAAVTYDSHDPIDRTLASFAINLNNSPSLSQILTQARGEQVEVTLINTANQPGSLTGKIIGVEQQQVPSKEGASISVAVLNLWCAEGVRAIKLGEVQKLRFANPVIENEFRRALETLALSHDSQKKAVSLHFAGEGKRKVEVGYVIESPIWKTSYRLVLDDKNAKPYLQGWAVVENPTDEDWQKVTMALVSGRPISFKMDLYNPLYVQRPTVEPELFASLRPPTYSGAMNRHDALARQGGAGGGFGGPGGPGGGLGGPPGAHPPRSPRAADATLGSVADLPRVQNKPDLPMASRISCENGWISAGACKAWRPPVRWAIISSTSSIDPSISLDRSQRYCPSSIRTSKANASPSTTSRCKRSIPSWVCTSRTRPACR